MNRIENMPDGEPKELLSFHPLPVRISEALLPRVQEHYDRALSPSQQLHYERGLHRIQRMDGLREEGIPLPKGAESDLEHVVGGCRLVTEIAAVYPALGNSINFEYVQKTFLWHDAGEIIIGDIPMRNRTHEQTALKQREAIEARERLLPRITDPSVREEVRRAYDSHVEKNQNDPNALMSTLIDKLQALRTIAALTTDMVKTDPEIREKMRAHFFDTLHPITQPAFRLMVILPTQEEREAIETLFNNELQKLIELGHGEAVQDFRDQQAA